MSVTKAWAFYDAVMERARHGWATTFSLMTKASEQKGEDQ